MYTPGWSGSFLRCSVRRSAVLAVATGSRIRGRYRAAAMTPGIVNLYSDTQTRPTDGMRRAMASAEVGDEQRGADPTVIALQERVAELLGHEAGLFLPSGTMCNAISFRLHLRPGGDEVLLDRTSHPINAEAGGPAAISSAMMHVLDGDGGRFTAAQVT